MPILACLNNPITTPINGADWRQRALCRGSDVDPELFFSDKLSEQAQAASRCQECLVKTLCLQDELAFPASEQHGIRGGLTASQRRKLLRGPAGVAPTRSYRAALLGSFPTEDYPLGGGA